MGGKASVLLVLGFSMLFLVKTHNFSNLTTRALDNTIDYYTKSKAHNACISGANMASNMLFFDKDWDTGFSNLAFDNAIIDVTIDTSGENKLITSIGTFNGVSETTIVSLKPSNYAKFGNFYKNLSACPATGDTFNGPFHSNGQLKVYGDPVFWGKATCKQGLVKIHNPSNPKFYGGFESGVDIPLEYDFSGLESKADKVYKDTTGTAKKCYVRLYFNADGTVTHSFKLHGGSWSAEETTALSALAPNGIIYAQDANIYVKGTVNGRVSIYADTKGSGSVGNVYLVDDIVYNTDPRIDPSSTDMLGIIAENKIRIEYNDDTKTGQNIHTHASMFALYDTIGPESDFFNSATKYPHLASWKIFGGLIAKDTRATAAYSGGVPIRGLRFVHDYDERFMTMVPPSFPHTNYYEIVSWLE